jgi:hypothetical protein
MKKIPRVTYKTAEELQKEIDRRLVALDLLKEGEVKQKMRVQLAQLRAYADVKRWLTDPR